MTDIMKVPEMKKALQAERSNDLEKAIDLYREVANNYPDAPLPNLQLANLLFEQKKDYLAAIFHYKRFLDLIDQDDSRFVAVTDRIRVAEQNLAYRYAESIAEGSANENMQLVQSITKQNQKIARLESDKADLVASNLVLQAELKRSLALRTRLMLMMEKMRLDTDKELVQKPSSPGVLTSHVVSNEDGTKKVVQTYEVKRGDNLSRIAEACYGNAGLWKRIKEANPDKIEKDRVRPGDVLIIPMQ